jgi:hypothetical protein
MLNKIIKQEKKAWLNLSCTYIMFAVSKNNYASNFESQTPFYSINILIFKVGRILINFSAQVYKIYLSGCFMTRNN